MFKRAARHTRLWLFIVVCGLPDLAISGQTGVAKSLEERSPRVSVRRDIPMKDLLPGCIPNPDKLPCGKMRTILFQGPFEYPQEKAVQLGLEGLPYSYVNVAWYWSNRDIDQWKCTPEVFTEFRDWYSATAAASLTSDWYISLLPNEPSRCLFAFPPNEQNNGDVFVVYSQGKILGRLSCSTFRAFPNPQCELKFTYQNVFWADLGRFPRASAELVLSNLPHIVATAEQSFARDVDVPLHSQTTTDAVHLDETAKVRIGEINREFKKR
ncbi:hypothetical protein [Aliiroseovarius lamellibrachiae]|uniref:hypothetical protein n=1 Tax=Aliiroseovarius lamellibrachiae TaxID=1924933 RepID=UPI001BDFB818|nr:hypothetical protein [Aliiroseovarius lamellibrachiae]MBT2132570.1 hypothetical protein [Aliiroseovarius lamellibrachiae]